MGLILCKELVELNGGCLAVSSEPMRGSTFTFRLPIAERPAR
jgi:signal transduction histidine kinase